MKTAAALLALLLALTASNAALAKDGQPAATASVKPVAAPSAVAPMATPVIAIVDVQRILQESLAAQSVRNQLEAQRSRFQSQISEEEKNLRAMEDELKQNHDKMAADSFGAREQKLREKFTTVERDVQARRRALDQAFNDSMGIVRTNLLEVVQTIAKERTANLVLLKQQVLWHDATLDITDDVLTRLNTRLPKVEVTIKQESGKQEDSDQGKEP